MPTDLANWAFEYKWDGVRGLMYWDGRRVLVESRNLLDVTSQYPEIAALAPSLGTRTAVLDGEIVALDSRGCPSFSLLQRRMHVASSLAVRKLMEEVPVYYMIFDVLHLDGRNLRDLPYLRRREILESLRLDGDRWSTPEFLIGKGPALLKSAARLGLEGVMAKRIDSRYLQCRSRTWLKVKLFLRQEFVIGGYTPGKGGLAGGLGAILVGCYDHRAQEAKRLGVPQKFHYAGSVGTGFTAASNKHLLNVLRQIPLDKSPFTEGRVRRDALWVEPILLAEVEFREWTPQGILRQPSFKGLRTDKEPTDVVREI